MREYLESIDDVLSSLDSTINGLSSDEAMKRMASNGPNKLKEEKKESLFKKFLKELSDPMLIILIAAALLSIATSLLSGEVEWADAIIIFAVVLINAVLGVYQESKAEKAIDALQKMSQAKSKVRRSGKITIINSEDLVVGDILLLEAGDSVPADGRIIFEAILKSDEAALTGESLPIEKTSKKLNQKEKKLKK